MNPRLSFTVILITALVLCFCFPNMVQAEAQPTIKIFVNGKQIESDVNPVIIEGSTMVPLRVIADNLGRHVSWDQGNRSVIISKTEAGVAALPSRSRNSNDICIMIEGREIQSEVPPFIESGRTMVPIRVVAEGLGMKVAWDSLAWRVCIDEAAADSQNEADPPAVSTQDSTVNNVHNDLIDPNSTILGTSQASAAQMKALLFQKNPGAAPEIADLYLEIGTQYGLRGDIAFFQAAKETKWWLYGGLVQAFQNNFCGLGATGSPATGDEDLQGADPARVSYQPGVHGAIFDTTAAGIEAHIQHLYAYAMKGPLPEGKVLLDPRFTRPARGCAPRWADLGGKWAVPGYDRSYASFAEAFAVGKTYGQSILNDYYAQLFSNP